MGIAQCDLPPFLETSHLNIPNSSWISVPLLLSPPSSFNDTETSHSINPFKNSSGDMDGDEPQQECLALVGIDLQNSTSVQQFKDKRVFKGVSRTRVLGNRVQALVQFEPKELTALDTIFIAAGRKRALLEIIHSLCGNQQDNSVGQVHVVWRDEWWDLHPSGIFA